MIFTANFFLLSNILSLYLVVLSFYNTINLLIAIIIIRLTTFFLLVFHINRNYVVNIPLLNPHQMLLLLICFCLLINNFLISSPMAITIQISLIYFTSL